MDEITSQGGQATEAPEPQGQPETTPTQSEQVSTADTQTQATTEENSFTDFNSLPEDVRAQLEPWYKQMQGDYTRKTQRLSKQEKELMAKVQAYDQFSQAPIPTMQQLAQQYGYQMVPASAQPQPQAQQSQQQSVFSPDWTPNSWEEAAVKFGEFLKPQFDQRLQEMVAPYQHEIAELKAELGHQKAGRIEQQFNQIDPKWREYEPEMRELLNDHPTLAKDPAKLYRLAMPEERIKSQAVQEALKILEAKTASAKIETSGRSKPSSPSRDDKPVSFDEAFRRAKQSLGGR